tara:strand:- start:224 stop:484 length:261 start_codon:yes stop_codon:yes gene_type:complete
MKLKVGDVVAWCDKSTGAIRSGQYLGNHVYRLKQEKKPVDGIDEDLVRVWPTRVTQSSRKLSSKVKTGSVPFVTVTTERLVKVPQS